MVYIYMYIYIYVYTHTHTHTHNGILLSHKNELIWVSSMRLMNLEPIIQSEVSQKEKYNYHILTHIYGI